MRATAKPAQPLATTSANTSNSIPSPTSHSNGISASKHTSQAHQPSPLRNSSPPDLNAPLQVKPLKAPNSPLLFQGVIDRKSPRVGVGKASPLSVQRKPLPPEALSEGLGLTPSGLPGGSSASQSLSSPRIERSRLSQQIGKPQSRQDRSTNDMTAALSSMSLNGTVSRPRKGAPSLRPAVASMASSGRKDSPRSATSSSAASSSNPRIRKGQKLEDIQAAQTQPMPALSQIDSPFQVQEYIALLVKQDPHNVERIVALPQANGEAALASAANGGSPTSSFKGKGRDSLGSNEDDSAGAFMGIDEEPVQSVDTDIWVFEQLRRLVLDFTSPWLTALQRDCDRNQRPETCHAMNAEEWMYLCASHGEEKQCCAIDYVIHTLDGTTALLNSQRHFPSRTYVPTTSLRHFGSVSRRLSRIFVHAFEHHREVFEACEAETSLYARFLALVERYDLIAVDALPKLGKPATVATDGKADVKDADAAQELGKDEAAAKQNGMDNGDDFAPRSRPTTGTQKLFDAGPVSKEADDEEDAGDDEVEGAKMDADDMKSSANGRRDASPEKEQGAPLERSESVASRVTAVARDPSPAREDEAGLKEEDGVSAIKPSDDGDVKEEVKEEEAAAA